MRKIYFFFSLLLVAMFSTGTAAAQQSITSLDELSNTAAYVLQTENRGYLVYAPEKRTDGAWCSANTTKGAAITVDEADRNNQWAILTTASGCRYLYSLGAQKFCYKLDGGTTLTDVPVSGDFTLLASTGANKANYPVVPAFGADQINLSKDQDRAVFTNWNQTGDEGNMFSIRKVADLTEADLASANAAIAQFEGTLDRGALSADDLSNSKVYVVSNTRGTWSYDPAYSFTDGEGVTYSGTSMLVSTGVNGASTSLDEVNKQFAFIKSSKGNLYLYSVGAQKFVSKNGDCTALSEEPSEAISILTSESFDYPVVVALGEEQSQIGISHNYTQHGGIITFWNNLSDAGNTVTIKEVEGVEFDATALVAKIDAFENPAPEPLTAYFLLPTISSNWVEGNGWDGCMYGVDLHNPGTVTSVPFKIGEEGIFGVAGTLAGDVYYAVLSDENTGAMTLNALNCATGETTLVSDLSSLTRGDEVRDMAYDAATGKLYALVNEYTNSNVAIYEVNVATGVLTKVAAPAEEKDWRALAMKDGKAYVAEFVRPANDWHNMNLRVSTVDLSTAEVAVVMDGADNKTKNAGSYSSMEFHNGLLYLVSGNHVYEVNIEEAKLVMLTSETTLPQGGAGICFATSTANPGKPNADMLAALETAKAALALRNPGYPTTDSEAYTAFAAAIATAEAAVYTATEDDITALNAALTAYKSATEGIQLPEGGKSYSFTSVSKDGREYYLNYVADTEVVLVERTADTVLPATAIFECIANDDNTLSFKTNDGNYLVFHNQSNRTDPHTGFSTELNVMTSITLAKMVNGGAVAADSQADLFGFLYWSSKRDLTGNRTGSMVIKYGNNGTPLDAPVYDAASAPFFNDNFSSAFRVEEQVLKTAVSIDPAPGHYDALPTTVKLTFNKDVTVEQAFVVFDPLMQEPIPTDYTLEGQTITVNVPAEMLQYKKMFSLLLQVRDADGELFTYGDFQEGLVYMTYTTTVPANIFESVSVTPAEGEVESLKEFKMEMNNPAYNGFSLDGDFIGGIDDSKEVVLVNAEGDTVTTATVTFNVATAIVTLAEEVTAAGTYTLVVPEATIYNSMFDETEEDFGVAAYNAVYNPEIRYTYTIAEQLEPATVEANPAAGHYDALPADVTLTFSKEIKSVETVMVITSANPRGGIQLTEENYTLAGNVLTVKVPEEHISGIEMLTLVVQATDADDLAVNYSVQYTTTLPADRFVYESAAPAAGEVGELETIELTFVNASDDMDFIGGIDSSKEVVLKNEKNEVVATGALSVKMDENDWETNVLIVKLSEKVSTAGTYTLVVPAGTVYNSQYYESDDDLGVANGAIYNPEVTIVYTLKPTGISSVGVTGKKAGIYTVGGQKVNETDVKKLERGVYIVNGKKVVVE